LELRVKPEIVIACDSHISWCRHRHSNPPDVQREMDELIAYLRRGPKPEPETEPQRVNRIMRRVLGEQLSKLEREAKEAGWT
jgi:hypothetical protein